MFSHSFRTKYVRVGAIFLVCSFFSPLFVYAADGDAEVATGDAASSSDTINVSNTNETNSNGSVVAESGSLGNESLDIRNDAPSMDPGTTGCSGECSSPSTQISNENNAETQNNIGVAAGTGENNASGTGTTTITTGDAYAAANVVNIANTNIVDSNYLLVVFNNLGDWSGDLVLPNGDFFAAFLALFNPYVSSATAQNDASITNNVDVEASTGANTASGTSTSITTGEAYSTTNVYNQVNTTIVGGSSFYLLIKVAGDWTGDIFNLPAGVTLERTDEGIVLSSQGANITQSGTPSVSSKNTASIENNVDVHASTGDNNATGDSAMIRTGNAYAAANVVNIVNTNIVSTNWMLLLLNILGSWKGNISFGQPDLWVGTVGVVDGVLDAGSTVTFTTTIRNNGDAPASQVALKTSSDSSFFKFSDDSWDVGTLKPGESRQVTYSGSVDQYIPDGSTDIRNIVQAVSHESDGNKRDNTDTMALAVAYTSGGPTPVIRNAHHVSTYPDLHVEKKIATTSEYIFASSSLDYTIIVTNEGGAAYEAVLHDILRDQSGAIVHEQSWDLGEIKSNEEVRVSYTTEFASSTIPGMYTNTAWVEALGGDYTPNRYLATQIKTVEAVATITVLPPLKDLLQNSLQNADIVDVHVVDPVDLLRESTPPYETRSAPRTTDAVLVDTVLPTVLIGSQNLLGGFCNKHVSTITRIKNVFGS